LKSCVFDSVLTVAVWECKIRIKCYKNSNGTQNEPHAVLAMVMTTILSEARRATTCTTIASILAAILLSLSQPLSDKGKVLYPSYVQVETLALLL